MSLNNVRRFFRRRQDRRMVGLGLDGVLKNF
jgi:hypothetical protein